MYGNTNSILEVNGSINVRPIRLAVAVSHPIQHFALSHWEIAKIKDVELRAFFCCDWGVASYVDRQFRVQVCWASPLLEGYPYEFLPTASRPRRMSFWQLDNPGVEKALERFSPDLVQVFGYAHRMAQQLVDAVGALHSMGSVAKGGLSDDAG